MSESDTVFNERDRRCAAVQLMPSTGPSYDNRTIASTLKMQIWTVQRAQNDENKVSGNGCRLSSEGHIMPAHIFEVGLKVNTKVYLDVLKSVVNPWCNQVASGSRTQHRPTSPKKPRLGFRRSATTLYPSLTGHPPLPIWTRWTTSFGHTSGTSPTWHPTTPKLAWSSSSIEYSPSSHRCLWKRHAPSSGSVSRWWLRLKAATLNRCQLYYIIKLPEMIFAINFKNKAVVLFSLGRQFYRSTLYILLCMYVTRYSL